MENLTNLIDLNLLLNFLDRLIFHFLIIKKKEVLKNSNINAVLTYAITI